MKTGSERGSLKRKRNKLKALPAPPARVQFLSPTPQGAEVNAAPDVCLFPCVWLEWYSRAAGDWIGARTTEEPYHRAGGSRNVETKLASRSRLTPGHLDMGRMRPLCEKSPASTDRRLHGRECEGVEECSQDKPGMFQALLPATVWSVRSPHKWRSPLNPWTCGRVLFHGMDESTGQCGVERERRSQRKNVHWGKDACSHPRVGEPLEMRGRQPSHTQNGTGGGWGVRVEIAPRQESLWEVGAGKGQGVVLCPHSLQKLKIPKRGTVGRGETRKRAWPCFRAHWAGRCGRKVGVDGRGVQSRASPTPPDFFR